MDFNPAEFLGKFKDIQKQMSDLKSRIQQIEAEGYAGGDLVKVKMRGDMSVVDVSISPEAVDPDDLRMLEDLVLAAVTDAIAKVRERISHEVPGVGDFNLSDFSL